MNCFVDLLIQTGIIFNELLKQYLIQDIHPEIWHSSDTVTWSAHPIKIAFSIRVFGALNQIMKQQTTFLIIFNIF